MIAAALVVQKMRLARALMPVLASIVVLPVILLGAAGGALSSGEASMRLRGGEAAWGSAVPADIDTLYASAAERFDVPLGILRAVGKVECDHNQPTELADPGDPASPRRPRCDRPNAAGAQGPMQFLPATFDRWSWASEPVRPRDPEGRPRPASIVDPTDSIYAAAAKLAADGVGADPWRALWAYNHSDRYVATVLGWAVAYGWRTDSRALLGRAVLNHPSITVRPTHAVDLEGELVDARVLSALLALATRHALAGVGPFTQHDYYVNGTTRPSNHVFGRAVDVAVVDGGAVNVGNRAAHHLVAALVLSLPDDIRPDEVLSPWEVRVGDAWSVTDGDHGDHIHLGYDEGSGS